MGHQVVIAFGFLILAVLLGVPGLICIFVLLCVLLARLIWYNLKGR